MKASPFLLLALLGCVIWLSIGCYDEPDPVGAGTLPDEDFGIVRVDTFYATDHSSLYNLIYTLGSDRVMLGKFQTYEAWTCLKFYPWPDSLLGATITSATIQMKTTYHFYDTTTQATFDFDVYRAKAAWTGDSVTYDSLNQNYYFDINNPIPVQLTIPPSDTDWVSITLDTSIVREWFTSNTDTTDINDGLILKPKQNANIIKGFYSFNASDETLRPILLIEYITVGGQPGVYSHNTGISRYVSKVDPAIFRDDRIYVQKGVSYRGLITFNNISMPWPVSIHQAVLQMTLDTSASSSGFIPFDHDSLYAFSVSSNGISDGLYYDLSQRIYDINGQYIYQFEALSLARLWLNNTSVRKVALSGYFESNSFDLFTFYGSRSNIQQILKPRIIITYTIKY